MAMLVCLALSSMTSTSTIISPLMSEYVIYYTALGYSASTVKLIMSLPKLTTLLVTLIGVGYLIDHVDNKTLGIIGTAGVGVFGILCAFIIPLPLVLICRGLQGCFLGLVAPFFVGYLGRLWEGGAFKRLVGLKQSSAALFSTIGSLVVSALTINFGFTGAYYWFILDIVLAVMIAIFLPSMPAPTKEERAAEKAKADAGKANGSKLPSVDDEESRKARNVLFLVAFAFLCMNVIRFGVYSQLTFCITENGGTTAAASVAQSLRSASAGVFAIFYKEASKYLKKYQLPSALVICAIGMYLIGVGRGVATVYIGAIIFGGFYGLITPAFNNAANNAKKKGCTVNVKNAGIMVIAQDLGSFLSAYIMEPLFRVLNVTTASGEMITCAALFGVSGAIVCIILLFRGNKTASVS